LPGKVCAAIFAEGCHLIILQILKMTASLLWFSDSSDFPGAVSPVWGLQIKENAAKFGENSEKN